MVIYKVRAKNFTSLVETWGGPAAMARALDCSPSAVSQCTGKRPRRDIGEKRARGIETKLSLDAGWLDIKRS